MILTKLSKTKWLVIYDGRKYLGRSKRACLIQVEAWAKL
jgi:hypothetical protein